MKESNRMIKEEIKKAVELSTPDVLPEVLHYMKENKGGDLDMIKTSSYREESIKEDRDASKMKHKWVKGIASLAVIFLLVFGIQNFRGYYLAESIINFDVNPSLEMKVNRSEKVLDVKALNEDGRELIGDMKLKNIDLDIALNALVGSMVKNGYISSSKNSILISVDSNKKNKGPELEKRLIEEINNILNQYEVAGSVLSQNIEEDKNIKELAEKYKISVGKAALIDAFINLDDTLAYEDLARLSINDLNLLLKDKYSNLEGVSKSGEANDIYIGKERAKEIALKDSKVKEEEIRKIEIELDYEKGRMIYEVEFKTNEAEYEYEIDANTGQIVDIEIEKGSKKTTSNKVVEKPKDNSEKNTSNKPSENNNTSNGYIGVNSVKNIAFKHAGVREDQTSKLEIELEREDGVMVYEVEFYVANTEYEYEINASTGKILEVDKKTKKGHTQKDTGKSTSVSSKNTGGKSSDQYIGVNSAKNIALKHSGLKENQVSKLEVELDKEDGIMVYEVEFKYSGYEYEYEINANTGKIIEWEKERD